MKVILKYSLFLTTVVAFYQSQSQNTIPALRKKGTVTQLIVDGNPFISLGGELGNSSASTMEYMQPVWPKLTAMNLNTVLMPVFWELIEKEEGKFDFTHIGQLITEARKNQLKIVFLWFGSWKNSMSSHAPAWVKLNPEKFPRAKDDEGRSQEILTPFSDNNLQADLKAFEKLMAFIKDFDNTQHTVIMVQVENEIGMLPTARDYHSLANDAFKKNVPAELMKYLQTHKDKLVPELAAAWKATGLKSAGTWEDVFGKSTYTDELFMSWYFSKYTNKIVEAGKKIYPLPMFVNAALNRPSAEPGKGYPSAGPLPHVMDVWKAAGPSIDFLAPDFYNPDFKSWNDLYTRQGDPLFIPEHRFDNTVAAKAAFAVGHYSALGFSPFSIESKDTPESEPLGKMYNVLRQLMPLITENQGQGKTEGVLLDKEHLETVLTLGKFEFTFRHDHTLPWSPPPKEGEWPTSGALLIQTGDQEFYIAGSGVVVTFKPVSVTAGNTGILKTEEGSFENGKWTIKRHLNGDQTHQGRHIRIPSEAFGIQRFELYLYK